MGLSSVLLVVLTASLCSPGSLSQTLHSVAVSDTVEVSQSTGGDTDKLRNVAREDMFPSENILEGSGNTADSMTLHELNNETAVRKESERVSNGNHSGSGLTLIPSPAVSIYSSGAQNQRADKAKDSITGYIHSTVITEDVPLDADMGFEKGKSDLNLNTSHNTN